MVVGNMEKEQEKKNRNIWGQVVIILYCMARKGLQALDRGNEGVSHADIWEKSYRQMETHVQRS